MTSPLQIEANRIKSAQAVVAMHARYVARLEAEREIWTSLVREHHGVVRHIAVAMGAEAGTARKALRTLGLWPLVQECRAAHPQTRAKRRPPQERARWECAIRRYRGNITRMAFALGVGASTALREVRAWGLYAMLCAERKGGR